MKTEHVVEVKIKNRYSEEDLIIFKGIIDQKITNLNSDLKNITASLNELNDNGDDSLDDRANRDSIKEDLTKKILDTKKAIVDYSNAQARINNKTFGQCLGSCNTLIPKERLEKSHYKALCCISCDPEYQRTHRNNRR